jgi:CRISPR/Cas system-associated exonuclease Cas4 (RecB family)
MAHVRIVESTAAALRLAEARAFLDNRIASGAVLIVSAARGAADDLARSLAVDHRATLGVHRFSFAHLAARFAEPVLAARDLAPVTYLGSEAVAARAAFDARRAGELSYFAPVSDLPGFPRALARTIQELRLAQVRPAALDALPLGGGDLAALLQRFEDQFAAASATDRASLFAAGREGIALGAHALLGLPLVLLDVPCDSEIEFDFLQALTRASADALITVPFGDVATLERLKVFGVEPDVLEQKGPSDLVALRRYLFASSQPPERLPAGDVTLFSAPGEGREAVEITRRILEEAGRGVRFDQMAVLLRAPRNYLGLLEHAFSRAGIPAWFDRGVRRPHPAGRAFLALLACAAEKLSARRFAEYLSLAQVPSVEAKNDAPFVPPRDELLGISAELPTAMDPETVAADLESEARDDNDPHDDDESSAIVDGTLRAPWKWERLIVESSVIGGSDRWHRRLAGLAGEMRLRIQEESRDDPESAVVSRLRRDLRNLEHLRAFALPVIEMLAAWPATATWGEWLDRFHALVPHVLRYPTEVLRVLGELRPMAEIGPVGLDEVRDVLADRLLSLQREPPRSRFGAVFVGSPHQARGRAFSVVFVPGLAERLFPQKPREDPMLLDREMRAPLNAGLATQEDRARSERLLLRLATGAATDRLWLSYPRMEMSESRPRVLSFYALDVLRAITGRIPDHEEVDASAAREGGASLAWPAPARPESAIDDLEHDLSVLRALAAVTPRASVRGHANYLLRLNDSLRRSVSARWARSRSSWTPHDGLVRATSITQPILATQRVTARPYSLSALQRFASCPYQFVLSAIYRLEPNEEPEPLQRLDPLTRGAIFHEVQARFFRALQAAGELPVTEANLTLALATIDRELRIVAAEQAEQLAPAIERVWRDEIADIGKDLRVWVRRLPEFQDWQPEYFEFSFGLARDADHDPRSLPDPIVVDKRFLLRGSVDLIERQRGAKRLRITDHKTGKNRTTDRTIIGGGAILQPVLYSLAVEEALGEPVGFGRLFYCTASGGFTDHHIAIDERSRRSGLEALEIVDRALELGFLPAAPATGACTWCDFRAVCGPHEEERIRRKAREKLGDLDALREKP